MRRERQELPGIYTGRHALRRPPQIVTKIALRRLAGEMRDPGTPPHPYRHIRTAADGRTAELGAFGFGIVAARLLQQIGSGCRGGHHVEVRQAAILVGGHPRDRGFELID